VDIHKELRIYYNVLFVFYVEYIFTVKFGPNTDVKASETSDVSTENKLKFCGSEKQSKVPLSFKLLDSIYRSIFFLVRG